MLPRSRSMKPTEGAAELGSAVLSRSRSTKAAAGRGRRSVSRRSISRRSPSPPPPASPIDARQLSPGMEDYGMDDRHMDGTEGYEEYQRGPDPMEMPDFGTPSTDGNIDGSTPGSSSAGRRAECWKHMTWSEEIRDGQTVEIATCNYCKSQLTARTGGGTGHLNRHYKACLKKMGAHMRGGGVQTQLNFEADGSVSTWAYNPHYAREEIARFIISEDQPIRMGESRSFERMIQRGFCPQYQHVSRRTTSSDILGMYSRELAALKEIFLKVQYSFALTSDIWTSSHQRTAYISVVAHYLDDEYKLNKRVIGFKLITESHTGDAIAELILGVIDDFQIGNKVVSITLDNASANTTAMNILTPRLQTYIGGYVLHQRCVCHILNLVVQDGMEVIGVYLNNIRDAIRFLSHSTVVAARFAEYCVANDKAPRKFGLDMKVRWNSTYIMLKNVRGYEHLISVFVNANSDKLIVANSDWEVVSYFREFLRPFYKATKALSGIYYPTSYLVIDFIWLIADKFAKSREHPLLSHVVAAMEEKFVKYFGSISHLYCFAIILDPTKKLAGLQMAMEGIGECLGLDFSEAFEHAKKEFVRVFRLYHDKLGGSTRSEASQQTHQSKTSLTAHLWKKLKGKSSSSPSQSQTPPKWNSTSELNHYLEHDFANMDPDLSGEGKLDLLDWWKNNKRIFPVLCHFARDVLLVPVSSVSSEATFSMVGRIIEERRSSLTPKMVEAITCLKDWELAKERHQHQLEDPEIVDALADLNVE